MAPLTALVLKVSQTSKIDHKDLHIITHILLN